MYRIVESNTGTAAPPCGEPTLASSRRLGHRRRAAAGKCCPQVPSVWAGQADDEGGSNEQAPPPPPPPLGASSAHAPRRRPPDAAGRPEFVPPLPVSSPSAAVPIDGEWRKVILTSTERLLSSSTGTNTRCSDRFSLSDLPLILQFSRTFGLCYISGRNYEP